MAQVSHTAVSQASTPENQAVPQADHQRQATRLAAGAAGLVADNAAAIFDPIVTELTTVRGSAASLGKAVRNFSDAISNNATQPKTPDLEIGTKLNQLIDRILERIHLAARSRREVKVAALSRDLHDTSRELDALSSFMQIVMADVGESRFDLQAFITDLRGLSERLRHVMPKIEGIIAETRGVQQAISGRLLDARHILQNEIMLPASADTNDPANEAPELALAQVQAFDADLSGRMSAMVACMQHPDAFRQRAEHVDELIQKSLDNNSDQSKAIIALVGAHCADMAAELDQVTEQAKEALQAMALSGDEASRRLHRTIDADNRTSQLEGRRAATLRTVDSIGKLRDDTSAALAGLGDLRETMAELQNLFASLSTERETVRVSAFNASIAAGRAEAKTAGMAAVADATGRAAFACAATIEELVNLVTDMANEAADIDIDALAAAFDGVEDTIRQNENVLNTIIEEFDAINAVAEVCENTLVDLATAARGASSRLESISQAVAAIREIANISEVLGAGVETLPGEDIASAIAFAEPLYTMASERKVHAELLASFGVVDSADDDAAAPAGETSSPDGQEDGGADLDSILF